jgi:hypothetical protein
VLLLLVEYGLFRQHAEREFVWASPFGGGDQTVYLFASYDTYETMKVQGLWKGVWYGLTRPQPNGCLIHVEAALLYLVLGPSRLAALTLNFLWLALAQLALFATIRWASGRRALAWASLGLLLLAASPFQALGGVFDFRTDCIAQCVFGLSVCLVIRSRVFQSWRWSLGVGLACTALVLTRHLALLYLLAAFAALVVLFGATWLVRHDSGQRRRALCRLVGLFCASLVLIAVALPVIWQKRAIIRGYYITHLTNGENAIRNRQLGCITTRQRLLYYPRSLFHDHAGVPQLAAGGAVLVAGLLLRRWRGRPEIQQVDDPGQHLPVTIGATALCVAVPVIVPTLYASPSPVVVGIALLPLVCLPALGAAWLLRGRGGRANYALRGLALAVLLCGLATFANPMSQPLQRSVVRSEEDEVLRLYDRIAEICQERDWSSPHLTFNTISTSLDVWSVLPLAYERQGLLLHVLPQIGGIVEVPEAAALAALARSDIVVMDRFVSAECGYPLHASMQELEPKMRAVCEREFEAVGRYYAYGQDVTLYVRPSVAVSGISYGHWVTRQGLKLTGSPAVLRSWPRIELWGRDDFRLLGKRPAVRAEIVTARGRHPVAAGLTSGGGRYLITMGLRPEEVPDAPPLAIHLSFDTFFVPHNGDKRQLVMHAPDDIRLVRQPPAPTPEKEPTGRASLR